MKEEIILITGEAPSSARHEAVMRVLDSQPSQAVAGVLVLRAPPELPEFLGAEPSGSMQHGPRRKRGKGNKYHRS